MLDDAYANPWSDLPEVPPIVAAVDRPYLTDVDVARADLKLHLEPVPFLGDPRTAKVVVLGLNPGWVPATDIDERGEYAAQNRLNLTFRSRTSFFSLDPALASTPGYRWWTSRWRLVAQIVGPQRLRDGLACVEWFPYHSATFRRLSTTLPSQLFGFALVRHAIRRGACIVVMRSRRLWQESVPELNACDPIELRVPRSAFVTPSNVGEHGFQRVCDALT